MATLTPYTFNQWLDDNGNPLAGGKIYTYEAGTTTPKATYTDETEDTANANPVILDANGRADIWLGAGNYKLEIQTSADVLIKTVDNVAGQSTGGVISYDIATNTAITEVYDRAVIYCTASPTLSLLPVADATDGFEFWVRNEGAGVVTLDPDASETINDASTFTLNATEWVRVVCDGDEWHVFDKVAASTEFDDSTFRVIDDGDNTKKVAFQASGITTATTRTLTLQDSDGTVALTSDIPTTATDSTEGIVELATEVEVETGTDTSRVITPDTLQGALGFTRYYESTGQTISNGSLLTLTHSLSATPVWIQVYLQCTTADLGYAIGDQVMYFSNLSTSGGLSSTGLTVAVNSTDIKVQIGASGIAINQISATAGNTAGIDNSDWDLYVRAWA